ncbi:TetR/AcrR family transcriptional regulator [Nonomuraea sp. NPDC050663]|uniref:TetR/AcrR family transcriptional regulator n=1 Tax=Nonomuraea sp. NPDC050663 TaxID=3364370 RepID=UPI0037963E54
MPPNPEETRNRLISAAERLFAERGVDTVSLREINAAAGQRNNTALQYHFGDRAALVRAVLGRHQPGVEAARHRLLDAYEAGAGDPGGRRPCDARRELAGALVRPAAAKLGDPEGGRDYLRILGQLVARPEPAVPRDSMQRWRELVEPWLPDGAARLHQRFMAVRVTYAELARRALLPSGGDERLFTSHLVDVVAAVLAAEVSQETALLLAERD